jgi:UbiD family decarboxylase
VHLTPGGCSWLHAVVQIEKRHEEDGRRAIEAAFRGHSSLKHAFVVDADIPVDDGAALEWALATRFQGDRDLVPIGRARGSSLDPSRDVAGSTTYKLGFDLTMPLGARPEEYCRALPPCGGGAP